MSRRPCRAGRVLWRAFLVATVSSALSAAAAENPVGDGLQRQQRINAALRSLLELADSGVAFLVYDRAAAELRLQQERALLRTCEVVDDLTEQAMNDLTEQVIGTEHLTLRIRRYRRSHAYAAPAPSPFDWEQYKADDADGACALHFASGLLLYASPAWGEVRPPALRLAPADLRALYNTLPEDAAIVILPPGWDEVVSDHER